MLRDFVARRRVNFRTKTLFLCLIFAANNKNDLLFFCRDSQSRKEAKKMADTGTTQKKLQRTKTAEEMAKDLRVQTQAVEIARIKERYEVMYTLAKYMAHKTNSQPTSQPNNSDLEKIVADTILSNGNFEAFFDRINPGQEAILLSARTDIKRREAQKTKKETKKVQTTTPQ
jgi:hypothetical protein